MINSIATSTEEQSAIIQGAIVTIADGVLYESDHEKQTSSLLTEVVDSPSGEVEKFKIRGTA